MESVPMGKWQCVLCWFSPWFWVLRHFWHRPLVICPVNAFRSQRRLNIPSSWFLQWNKQHGKIKKWPAQKGYVHKSTSIHPQTICKFSLVLMECSDFQHPSWSCFIMCISSRNALPKDSRYLVQNTSGLWILCKILPSTYYRPLSYLELHSTLILIHGGWLLTLEILVSYFTVKQTVLVFVSKSSFCAVY